MGIVEQLILITFVVMALLGVIIAQLIALSRVLGSRAWQLIAVGFLLLGVRQLWGMIRTPLAILRAQAEGRLPEQFSAEQWLMIAGVFLALGMIIWGLDTLRRDLRRVGV